MKFTATNSKILSDQIYKFNCFHAPLEAELVLNWGREGKRRTWFANDAWGSDLQTGLSFDELVTYVQSKADAVLEAGAWIAREEATP